MSVVLLSTAYLAPVSYYVLMAQAHKTLIEQHESYQKQTYRNRCIIATANGPLVLTIPVQKALAGQNGIREIRIADHGNWRHMHWNSLVSAYRASPFFDFYQDDIRPFFEAPYRFLFDFNEALRECVCSLLNLDIKPVYTEAFESVSAQYNLIESATTMQNSTMQDSIMQGSIVQDYRNLLHPKKDRLNESILCPYYQVFEQKFGFLPDLSILDLLFNLGPEALLILMNKQ